MFKICCCLLTLVGCKLLQGYKTNNQSYWLLQ